MPDRHFYLLRHYLCYRLAFFFCSLTPDMIIKSSIGYSVIKHALGFYFIKNIVDRNTYNKIQKQSVYIIIPVVLVSRQILLLNPYR